MKAFVPCALFTVWGATAALAQAQGDYPATLFCEAGGGAGPIRHSFIVAIAGGRATYAIRALDGSESGTGSLAGSRLVVTATGRQGGTAYTARYAGEVGGRGGTLTGSRTLGTGARAVTRACQFVLGDGRN